MNLKEKRRNSGAEIHYHTFKGMEYIPDFMESFKGTKVLVYFDPDVDGLVSGLFACRALSEQGIEFQWHINSNRAHGFLLPTEKVKGMNILCVDFLIPEEQLKELVDAGCNILSLDHHENGNKFIEYSNGGKKGIVINNQYDFEEPSGKYLSGAGVVFECFIDLLGEKWVTAENKALVGLSLLTDIRDIENNNARMYLQELYNHKCKGYIGYLIDCTMENDFGFGVPRLDRNYVDYTFSPVINSCLRFNRQDDVVRFFLGSGYINKDYHKMQKELILDLKEHSKVVSFSNLNIVIIDGDWYKGTKDEDYLSNFVGLLASQFLDGERSAIAYILQEGKAGRASFRGRVNGLKYWSALKCRINGIGHEPAFGIIGLQPSKELFLWSNTRCGELEEGSDYSKEFITTQNLSITAQTKGYDLGLENIYCLSQHRVYIKYLGKNVKRKRFGARYTEWEIDGVSVMSFDEDLNPCGDLIMPILERGNLCFYLNTYAK